jgi:hypothetical protein
MRLKLKTRILEKYGSQVAFAHDLGEREDVVSRVVRGWRKVPSTTAEKWAEALDCKPEEIFK